MFIQSNETLTCAQITNMFICECQVGFELGDDAASCLGTAVMTFQSTIVLITNQAERRGFLKCIIRKFDSKIWHFWYRIYGAEFLPYPST